MGHAHAALRPIGPCALPVRMSVFIIAQLAAGIYYVYSCRDGDDYGDSGEHSMPNRGAGRDIQAAEKNASVAVDLQESEEKTP